MKQSSEQEKKERIQLKQYCIQLGYMQISALGPGERLIHYITRGSLKLFCIITNISVRCFPYIFFKKTTTFFYIWLCPFTHTTHIGQVSEMSPAVSISVPNAPHTVFTIIHFSFFLSYLEMVFHNVFKRTINMQ